MSGEISPRKNGFQVVKKTSMKINNDRVLIKEYFAIKNTSKVDYIQGYSLNYPFYPPDIKIRDEKKNVRFNVKNLPDGSFNIEMLFEPPIAPGEKKAFVVQWDLSRTQLVFNLSEILAIDWGASNLDEIVFDKDKNAIPFFISMLGSLSRRNGSYVYKPPAYFKKIKSHQGNKKSLRIEIGNSITYKIQETYSFYSRTRIDDFKIILSLPASTTDQESKTFVNGLPGKIDKKDPANNFFESEEISFLGGRTIDLEVVHVITLKPRKILSFNIGKISSIKKLKNIKKYLQPTKIWDHEDNLIQALARNAIEKTDDLYEFLKLIFEFINQKINYQIRDGRTPASKVIRDRFGDCSELSDLFIATCRAAGIPAIASIGYTYDPFTGALEGHEWAKVFTEKGWLSFDPTWGFFGQVSSQHIEIVREVNAHDLWGLKLQGYGDVNQVKVKKSVRLLEILNSS